VTATATAATTAPVRSIADIVKSGPPSPPIKKEPKQQEPSLPRKDVSSSSPSIKVPVKAIEKAPPQKVTEKAANGNAPISYADMLKRKEQH
jgi:hypothetical protein